MSKVLRHSQLGGVLRTSHIFIGGLLLLLFVGIEIQHSYHLNVGDGDGDHRSSNTNNTNDDRPLLVLNLFPGVSAAGTATVSETNEAPFLIQDGVTFQGPSPVGARPLSGTKIRVTEYPNMPGGFVGGASPFASIVHAGDYIWFVPYTAMSFVRFHKATGAVTGYSVWPSGSAKTSSESLAYGSVYDQATGFIWNCVATVHELISFDTASGAMTKHVGWPTGFVPAGAPFRGGFVHKGHVWLSPYGQNMVVRVATVDGTMADMGNHGANFGGFVYDGVQFGWLVRHSGATTVKYDLETGVNTAYSGWPVGLFAPTEFFHAGAFDGQKVWMIPRQSNMFVSIDKDTATMGGYGTWPVGWAVSGGTAKFVSGGFDGLYVWAFPNHGNMIVRVDSTTGVMRGLSREGTTAPWGATFDLATQSIYLMDAPTNTLFRLQFSTVTETATETHEVTIQLTDGKSFNGIIPFSQTHPLEGSVMTYTEFPGDPLGYSTSGDKPFTVVLLVDDFIWQLPHDANMVIKINKHTGAKTGYSGWPGGVVTSFFGGAVDRKRDLIWMAPYTSGGASHLVSVSMSTGTLTAYNNWPGGVGLIEFYGALLERDYIWLTPFSASMVVRTNADDGTIMTGFNTWPTGGFLLGSAPFAGLGFDGDHTAWFPPYTASHVVEMNLWTGVMIGHNAYPGAYVAGHSALHSSTFDGQSLWMAPMTANMIVALDKDTKAMTGYNTWPAGYTAGTYALTLVHFDSKYLWFLPYHANQIIRLDPNNGGAMVGFENFPSTGWGSTFSAVIDYSTGSLWVVARSTTRTILRFAFQTPSASQSPSTTMTNEPTPSPMATNTVTRSSTTVPTSTPLATSTATDSETLTMTNAHTPSPLATSTATSTVTQTAPTPSATQVPTATESLRPPTPSPSASAVLESSGISVQSSTDSHISSRSNRLSKTSTLTDTKSRTLEVERQGKITETPTASAVLDHEATSTHHAESRTLEPIVAPRCLSFGPIRHRSFDFVQRGETISVPLGTPLSTQEDPAFLAAAAATSKTSAAGEATSSAAGGGAVYDGDIGIPILSGALSYKSFATLKSIQVSIPLNMEVVEPTSNDGEEGGLGRWVFAKSYSGDLGAVDGLWSDARTNRSISVNVATVPTTATGTTSSTPAFHHVLVVTIPYIEPNDVEIPEIIQIFVDSRRGFFCGETWTPEGMPLGFNLSVLVKPNAQLINKQLQEAVGTTALVTSTLSGAMGSPGVALYQLKMTSLQQLATCFFSHTKPLDVSISPTGMKFGKEHGQYYRGAIIGNFIIFLGITVFFLLLAGIIYALRKLTKATIRYSDGTFLGDYSDALATVHFPSVLVVPTALGFQGTVAASMALFIHSDDAGDIALAVFGGVICAASITYMGVLSTKRFFPLVLTCRSVNTKEKSSLRQGSRQLRLLRNKKNSTRHKEAREAAQRQIDEANKKIGILQRIGWAFKSDYHWVDPKPITRWKRRFLFLFFDYRFSYFLCLEMTVSLILGIIDGIRISERMVCIWLSFTTFAVFFAMFMTCIALKPSLTPFQTGFVLTVNCLGVIGSICLLVGLIKRDENALEVTGVLGVIVGFCGILKFGLDLSFAIMWAMETDYLKKLRKNMRKTFLPTMEDVINLENDEELQEPLRQDDANDRIAEEDEDGGEGTAVNVPSGPPSNDGSDLALLGEGRPFPVEENARRLREEAAAEAARKAAAEKAEQAAAAEAARKAAAEKAREEEILRNAAAATKKPAPTWAVRKPKEFRNPLEPDTPPGSPGGGGGLKPSSVGWEAFYPPPATAGGGTGLSESGGPLEDDEDEYADL